MRGATSIRRYPDDRLWMLAVTTTCRDRWRRQILNEADRIPTQHLLTVLEGVSESQFREVKESGVQLVVPSRLWTHYPAVVRRELVSLRDFIAGVGGSADSLRRVSPSGLK